MKSYLKYWTGLDVEKPNYDKEILKANNAFPIRCYFDNDSDELINYKGSNGLVDLKVYKELVLSLKAMGYNAIDIHDQLGRTEFYAWDSYKKYWNYKGDIKHIENIINIIHEEGMLVQIPMYLAWGFDPIGENAECWHQHGDLWREKWRKYMESPLGKGDIFLLRPRSPIYDCEYRCKCEECLEKGTGKIMTEVFEAVEKIILSKKSDAKLICDLYAEGYELWRDKSFSVSENWLLMAADNGYGKFPPYKELGRGPHEWGIYLHAGFWLNHTIQDTHIDPLAESALKAYELGITNYILVNGQSFKNFILNIEAIMAMIFKGTGFNRKEFIKDWVSRLFDVWDSELADKIDQLIFKIAEVHRSIAIRPAYLDNEEDLDRGFIGTMISLVYPLIDRINNSGASISEFAKDTIPFGRDSLPYGKDKARALSIQCKEILKMAKAIENKIDEKAKAAWNDQFTYPLTLLNKQMNFVLALFAVVEGEKDKSEAKRALKKLDELARRGSKLTKFKSWYYPENMRMHHPIPTEDIFKSYI